MEIYPPTFAKRWGIKKIPPSPGPRGPWGKEKKFRKNKEFSEIFRKNQEFSGIFRKYQEKSGKIRKNQEFSGIFRNLQEFSGIFRNFQEFQTPGGPGGEKNFFRKIPWA